VQGRRALSRWESAAKKSMLSASLLTSSHLKRFLVCWGVCEREASGMTESWRRYKK
jgi:hypothetical protein